MKMQIQDINLALKSQMPKRQIDALELSPYDIAAFLQMSSQALCQYIAYANEQIGERADGYISPREIQNISAIFKELYDNFFPMAHTNEPLAKVKIIEIDQILLVLDSLNKLRNENINTIHNMEELGRSVQRLTEN